MRNLLIVLLISLGLTASAQEVYTSSGRPANAKRKAEKKKEKGFDVSKLVIGGTIGFGMGGNSIAFSVAPMVGYRITDKFAAGVGFGYQYFRQKDFFEIQDLNTMQYNYYDYKASMISASVWARYLIFDKLFVHAEYEHNFMSFQNYRYGTNPVGSIEGFKEKLDVPSLLLGVGYRQPVSDNASIYIMGMYDVLQRDFSPYKGGIQPRIGFTIGF